MPWGRLDDSLYDHPKLDRLDVGERLAAIGLWARAISWCNRFLTDGQIPLDRIAKLDGTVELADRLVVAGLFEETAQGYAVHDFLQFNDSRIVVLKRREDEKNRKADYRAKKAQESRPTGTTNGTNRRAKHDVPPGQTVGQGSQPTKLSQRDTRARMYAESRPDPTRPTVEKVPLRRRGSRVNGAVTLSEDELEAWSSFGGEWDAFRLAWIGRGLRLPPSGSATDDDTSQRGLLYQILDARPKGIVEWVRQAPGKTAHDVVAHVLDEWRAVRAEAGLDDDTPDPDAISRSEAPVALAGILGKLVDG